MLVRVINKVRRMLRNATKPRRDQLPSHPDYWFRRIYAEQPASIVQVGSNDGKTGDPLHALLLRQSKWKALFVEPIPYIFERLKANYPAEDRFSFTNVAINDGSKMPFYYVTDEAKVAHPDLPYWFDQLGSFDRNHLTTHLDGKLAPFVRSMEVVGITLPQLLADQQLDRIDILHIDCEGYDWKVLAQLDLNHFQPGLILFEFHHLSPRELAEAAAFLTPHYDIFRLGIDYLAASKLLDDRVRQEMQNMLTTANHTTDLNLTTQSS